MKLCCKVLLLLKCWQQNDIKQNWFCGDKKQRKAATNPSILLIKVLLLKISIFISLNMYCMDNLAKEGLNLKLYSILKNVWHFTKRTKIVLYFNLCYVHCTMQCIHSALHNMVLSRYSFSGIYSFSETENISQGFKAEKIPFSGIKSSPSGALMFRKRRIVTANGLNDASKKYKQHNCRLQMSLVPAIWIINTFYLMTDEDGELFL